ncbi:hypothetical protein BDR26DRAFT_867843 [Obelidium mucronatum]|nr:hypothetical protein BDR26DRAFT_867843 [Obelidium mucronatum]
MNQLLLQPGQQEMDFDDPEVENQKRRVILIERFMLEFLCFDFAQIKNAHKNIIQFAKLLDIPKEVAQKAWSLADESYNTVVCIQYPAHFIALASLYLACRLMDCDQIPPTMSSNFAHEYYCRLTGVLDSCLQIIRHYQITDELHKTVDLHKFADISQYLETELVTAISRRVVFQPAIPPPPPPRDTYIQHAAPIPPPQLTFNRLPFTPQHQQKRGREEPDSLNRQDSANKRYNTLSDTAALPPPPPPTHHHQQQQQYRADAPHGRYSNFDSSPRLSGIAPPGHPQDTHNRPPPPPNPQHYQQQYQQQQYQQRGYQNQYQQQQSGRDGQRNQWNNVGNQQYYSQHQPQPPPPPPPPQQSQQHTPYQQQQQQQPQQSHGKVSFTLMPPKAVPSWSYRQGGAGGGGGAGGTSGGNNNSYGSGGSGRR